MQRLRIPGAEGRRTLICDLRSGHAGWVVRAGLSLVSAAAILSVAMLGLGVLEVFSGGWVRDEYVAVAMGVAAAVWCVTLALLWWSFRRFQVALKATFSVIAIWSVVLPATMLLDAMMSRGEGYMIAAVVCLGIALSIGLIVVVCYQRFRAGSAARAAVRVRMDCPECGYSLLGLTECRCPECGVEYTVETLVEALGRGQLVAEEMISASEPTEPSPPLPEPEQDGTTTSTTAVVQGA